MKLICIFVFAYAVCWFSNAVPQFIVGLGAALQKGFTKLESSPARPSLPQVMVTITATKSSNIEETKANAQTISDNKIHSIVVRLGLEPDKAEVQAVATDPGAVLTYVSAADVSADDLLSMICPAGMHNKTCLCNEH